MNQMSSTARWRSIQESVVALMRDLDLQKRTLSNTVEKARKDQAQLLLECLDVLDTFERVFANIEPRLESADRQARIWVGNFRSVRRVLENNLKQHGVAPIEAPDRMAVPGLHTIVETREQLDMEDGTIVEELQRGYLWQGKILRQAQVIAVKN